MGDNIKNAIIASEDADFYSNSGIEPLAIIKSSFNEVFHKNNISGGSTLTQQLIKNQLLDNSRSYERKAKEILLSLRLNNYFDKEEILETYLNIAPFGKNKLGQNISGIETAALGIFGIHSKELNIAQAAYLAGFVQSPYKYTPFDSNGNLKSKEELSYGFERQKYVLQRMLINNYISQKQYDEAVNFNIVNSFIKTMTNDTDNYPYIKNEVISAAAEILAEQTATKNNAIDKFKTDLTYKNELIENSRIKFITGGYKVKITINKALYDKLNISKLNFSSLPSFTKNGVTYPMQIGASVIENNTGKVLAFIGGMDYNKQQLNHATRTYRSPGSTIKPLLVYGPAMDKGYITPNSYVLDKRFNINGWSPENYAKVEYGLISARRALEMSLNLSAIRLYSAFMNENTMDNYLGKMNFKKLTEADKSNLSAAIGGLAYGVSVTENTNAFATFANMGEFKQSYIIEEISNNKNEVIYKANFAPIRVYSTDTSYMILNSLNDVLNGVNATAPDIAKSLKFNNKNLFVKTGTAEYNQDLWVVGGSKNITLGLWTGYDEPATMNGFKYAHEQWAYFMNTIYDFNKNLISPDTIFTKPTSIIEKNISQFDNSDGSTKDIVPSTFQKLTKEKVDLKFGYNIDKSAANYFSNNIKQTKSNISSSLDKNTSKSSEDSSENNNHPDPSNNNQTSENNEE